MAESSEQRLRLMLLLVLFALVGTCFINTLSYEFVLWDDDINVTSNPQLQRDWTAQDWRWIFTDTSYTIRYKPLTWLAYKALYEGFGLNPLPYHALNFTLHLLNSGLMYILAGTLLGRYFGASGKWRTWLAFLAATLWALHPLRAETVSWTTPLSYTLATAFCIPSMLATLQLADCDNAAIKKVYWALGFGTFVLATFSYPIGLTLPGVLMLLIYLPSSDMRREGQTPPAYRRAMPIIPHIVVALIVIAMTVHTRLGNTIAIYQDSGAAEASSIEKAVQLAQNTVYLGWKHLFPADMTPLLSEYHFWPQSAAFWLVVFAVLGAISIAAIIFARRQPGLSLLWLTAGILFAPSAGITEFPYIPSDRHLYMPGIIVALGMVAPLAQLADPKLRIISSTAMAIVTALFALRCHQQIAVWEDSIALFNHIELQLPPDSEAIPALRARRGQYHFQHADYQRAVTHLTYAIRSNPALCVYYGYLGYSYYHLGKFSIAETILDKAYRAEPTSTKGYYLVLAKAGLGKGTEARTLLDALLRDHPDDARLQALSHKLAE